MLHEIVGQDLNNVHPSEWIEINGKSVEIDKELIPLIKELNTSN